MNEPPRRTRHRRRVVLTGAWGGGKTTFLAELQRDAATASRLIVLPEAAPLVRRMGYDVDSQRFQTAVVIAQHALEDIAEVREGASDDRLVVSHRGSLDALAFWLRGGGTATDFFTLIASTRASELARYDAVLFFQTCARGGPDIYERYRRDHPRPPADEAERLDSLLEECWSRHPGFHRLVNGAGGWPEKAAAARCILDKIV